MWERKMTSHVPHIQSSDCCMWLQSFISTFEPVLRYALEYTYLFSCILYIIHPLYYNDYTPVNSSILSFKRLVLLNQYTLIYKRNISFRRRKKAGMSEKKNKNQCVRRMRPQIQSRCMAWRNLQARPLDRSGNKTHTHTHRIWLMSLSQQIYAFPFSVLHTHPTHTHAHTPYTHHTHTLHTAYTHHTHTTHTPHTHTHFLPFSPSDCVFVCIYIQGLCRSPCQMVW